MAQNDQKPMYLKSIVLQNYGPYKDMKFYFQFDEKSNPVPLVLIGKNGSGKTIFLSHIVNALISAKQTIYENSDIEKGKVYKYRSPQYISNESYYSYSKVDFSQMDASVTEWQLNNTQENIEKQAGFNKPNQEWDKISINETSLFGSSL